MNNSDQSSKKSPFSRWFIGVCLIVGVTIVLGAAFYTNRPRTADADVVKFAQCLASKNVTMYGADWCPHCQAEKQRFGDAFQYVPYVECPANPKQCAALGISLYPTWILGDGTSLAGEQGLEKLSAVTGCSLRSVTR